MAFARSAPDRRDQPQALAIPIEVTEAVLNHISGTRAGVAGIYNRYKFEPEKRAALVAWDVRLQEMLNLGSRLVETPIRSTGTLTRY